MIALAFGAGADFFDFSTQNLERAQIDRLELSGTSRKPRLIQGGINEVH
jgi:hypothetical protein